MLCAWLPRVREPAVPGTAPYGWSFPKAGWMWMAPLDSSRSELLWKTVCQSSGEGDGMDISHLTNDEKNLLTFCNVLKWNVLPPRSGDVQIRCLSAWPRCLRGGQREWEEGEAAFSGLQFWDAVHLTPVSRTWTCPIDDWRESLKKKNSCPQNAGAAQRLYSWAHWVYGPLSVKQRRSTCKKGELVNEMKKK